MCWCVDVLHSTYSYPPTFPYTKHTHTYTRTHTHTHRCYTHTQTPHGTTQRGAASARAARMTISTTTTPIYLLKSPSKMLLRARRCFFFWKYPFFIDHLYDNHTYLPAQVTFKDAVKGSQVFFFWKYPFFIDHLYDYHTYLPTQITLKSALKSSRMLFFPFFLHFFFGGKDDQSLRRPHLFTDSSHLQKCC